MIALIALTVHTGAITSPKSPTPHAAALRSFTLLSRSVGVRRRRMYAKLGKTRAMSTVVEAPITDHTCVTSGTSADTHSEDSRMADE